MKKKTRRALLFFFLGLLAGSTFTVPAYLGAKTDATYWRNLWSDTRDSWLQDRRDWRDGKAFEYNYGPHHRRW